MIITNSASTKTNKKGITSRIISPNGIRVTALITNNKIPYGGVIKPIIQLIIATTPKCTKSISNIRQAGKNRGIMTRIRVVASSRHPNSNKMIFVYRFY